MQHLCDKAEGLPRLPARLLGNMPEISPSLSAIREGGYAMKRSFSGFLFFVFVSVVAVHLLATPSFAFRCGDSLVGVGDSKAKVLLECGPPTLKETTSVKSNVKTTAPGKRSKNAKKVDQWYYNCGDNDFVYVLTFEGGVLVKESTSGRGKGPSHCLGKKY